MALRFPRSAVEPVASRLAWALHDPHKPRTNDRGLLTMYRLARAEARRVRAPVVTAAYEVCDVAAALVENFSGGADPEMRKMRAETLLDEYRARIALHRALAPADNRRFADHMRDVIGELTVRIAILQNVDDDLCAALRAIDSDLSWPMVGSILSADHERRRPHVEETIETAYRALGEFTREHAGEGFARAGG